MKKTASLSIAILLAMTILGQTAPAKSIGLLCAGTVHAQKATADIQKTVPVKAISHNQVQPATIIYTDQYVYPQYYWGYYKSAYPAPGYENVYNRYEARTTMGYKVLFDF